MRPHPVLCSAGVALVLALTAAPAWSDDALTVAFDLSDEMIPDPGLVEAIRADLVACRVAVPFLVNVTAAEEWVPGSILIGFSSSSTYTAAKNGENEVLNDLIDEYGPVTVNWLDSLEYATIRCETGWNSELLAAEFAVVPGTFVVEPDRYPLPDEGDDVLTDEVGTYTFRHGWQCDPWLCFFSHYWVLVISDGVAVLVDEYGDALTPVAGTSWSGLKREFGRGVSGQ